VLVVVSACCSAEHIGLLLVCVLAIMMVPQPKHKMPRPVEDDEGPAVKKAKNDVPTDVSTTCVAVVTELLVCSWCWCYRFSRSTICSTRFCVCRRSLSKLGGASAL
jgi:hypothetical protein